MDRPNGKEPSMAGGIRNVAESHVTDKDSIEPNGFYNETGGQHYNRKRVDYLKEATVVLDLMGNKDINAKDIIKTILDKVGFGNLLAVRPKHELEYELTLKSVDICEGLLDGVEIKGQFCEVKRLERREYIVSFLHLPAYVHDQTIEDKLESWGVTPVTTVRRRLYPGTNIADGTRYVKVLFPKEVTSLPYSTKFETSDGLQYFRVIHDGQVKLCRMCLQPGHIFKDCPNFTCFECFEQGHFAKNCKAEKCPDCKKVFIKCNCVTESEGESGVVEIGSENVRENVTEMEYGMNEGRNGFKRKELNKENGKETEKGKALNEGEGKATPQVNEIMETESNVETKIKTDQTRMKDQGKKLICNIQIDNKDAADETVKGDSRKSNENQVKSTQKKQNGGQHVLRYKEIPNLKLVLRKQKLRRARLKKKNKTFNVSYED